MTVIKQTIFECIPVGEYEVELLHAELVDGKFGQQVEFLFTVIGGEHDGQQLKSWTSASFSPKSRLYSYAVALFDGTPIPKTYDLDLADIIGRRAKAVVIIRTKESGEEFNRIDMLRPLRGPQQALPINGGVTPQATGVPAIGEGVAAGDLFPDEGAGEFPPKTAGAGSLPF